MLRCLVLVMMRINRVLDYPIQALEKEIEQLKTLMQ